jgi:hypothetical protein
VRILVCKKERIDVFRRCVIVLGGGTLNIQSAAEGSPDASDELAQQFDY